MNIDRWYYLMSSFGLMGNEDTFRLLVEAYASTDRYYHNTDHINVCLNNLDFLEEYTVYPREVELALWFHDAVYDPLSNDNERRSAQWAGSFLGTSSPLTNPASQEVISRVVGLIKATCHNVPVQTQDESILVDIDLSILGSYPETYDAFETGIRQEYEKVPIVIYNEERAKVLDGFLQRSRIYLNGAFECLEEQARSNLTNAIAQLELE